MGDFHDKPRFTLGYIDDAATARRTVYRSDGSLLSDCVSNYHTPTNGVHLCGVTDDGQQPTTVASYPMNRAEARSFWEAAREVAECAEDEYDFIVDLCISDQIYEDFRSNRQLWPRVIEAWNSL
ncbi:hypothetical protein ACMT1E_04480 [Sphingomonas flavalba]|uniref:hypothetical protein n=1 Tax=Sphingomonas flavalba TaxID=2559804 RepID=UPI0039E12610